MITTTGFRFVFGKGGKVHHRCKDWADKTTGRCTRCRPTEIDLREVTVQHTYSKHDHVCSFIDVAARP